MRCEACSREAEPDSFKNALVIVVDENDKEHLVCGDKATCKVFFFKKVKKNKTVWPLAYIGSGIYVEKKWNHIG